MRNMKTALLLSLTVALGTALAVGQEKKADAKKKPQSEPAISLASQAIQLAMEGQKRGSPTLMLAAAELLGNLKESGAPLKGVEVKMEGTASTKKKPLAVNVADWVDLARDYAKGDPELAALLEKRLDQLSKRGLVWRQGKDLPSVNIGTTTFKIINPEAYRVIGADQVYTARNVIFEAQKPAIVKVVGDGDGDLDLWVYDANGNLIGQDTDSSSICHVAWFQVLEGPVTIKVANVGRVAERFIVLANW